MTRKKRIRTHLHGDQEISRGELELLHTPAFQRLYDLHQLGFADRIYIDASHSRLQHVFGVLHHTEALISAIESNVTSNREEPFVIGPPGGKQRVAPKQVEELVKKTRPVARLLGLLHDLTHSPYGHTVEDEIHLVASKHDEPSRQADAFYRVVCQLIGWLGRDAGQSLPPELERYLRQPTTEPPTDYRPVAELMADMLQDLDEAKEAACWRLPRSDVAELLAQSGMAMRALLHMDALHKKDPKKAMLPADTYSFDALIVSALTGTAFESLLVEWRFSPHRHAFLLDVIGNTVCADLLDYAIRDSRHAGLDLAYDHRRIPENFTLYDFDPESEQGESAGSDGGMEWPDNFPFRGSSLRTAISLYSHKFRPDVPGELMNLLNVRMYLFERVIFHPTKATAGAMLGSALQLMGWRSETEDSAVLPNELAFLGDQVFLDTLVSTCLLALEVLRGLPPDVTLETSMFDGKWLHEMDRSERVAATLVSRHVGSPVQAAGEAIEAGFRLLQRVMARRYYRQVYRAIPSDVGEGMGHSADILAEELSKPDMRYGVERRIEEEAALSLGSVVIHCPRRKTAEKVAAVLITRPNRSNGRPMAVKLRNIGDFNGSLFGQHGEAIQAVEKMYASMWRLIVAVSPEKLPEFRRISKAAADVFEAEFGARRDLKVDWENDPDLVYELASKLEPRENQLRLPQVTAERQRPRQQWTEWRTTAASARIKAVKGAARNLHGGRLDRGVGGRLDASYSRELEELLPEEFAEFMSLVERAVSGSPAGPLRAGTQDITARLFEELDEILGRVKRRRPK